MSRPTEGLRALLAPLFELAAIEHARQHALGTVDGEKPDLEGIEAELDLTDAILRLSATADGAPEAERPEWLRFTDSAGRPFAFRTADIHTIASGEGGVWVKTRFDTGVVAESFDDVLALVSDSHGAREDSQPAKPGALCKALGCDATVSGHGWCEAHLAYWGGEP